MKKIAVFISDAKDAKAVYEVVRMSLGITAKGHKVFLFVSRKAMQKFDKIKSDEKLGKNFSEFLLFLEKLAHIRFNADVSDIAEGEFDVFFILP